MDAEKGLFQASRRRFLSTGAGIVGGGLLASSGLSSAWARNLPPAAVSEDLRSHILGIQAMPAWTSVRQLLAQIVTDPALPLLAKTTLQTVGTGFTGFQKDVLEALLVMTTDPAALAATITGKPLTKAQRLMMNRVRGTVSENPAIHRLIQAGAQLKGQPAVLQADVNQVIANSRLPVPQLFIPNNPPLSAVVNDNVALLNSSAFGQIQQAFIPLLQNPNFVGFLRQQSPWTVASFMPRATVLALELPGGIDPPLGPIVTDVFNLLAGIVTIIALFFDGVVVIVLGIIAVVLAAFPNVVDLVSRLSQDGDGDNDGD